MTDVIATSGLVKTFGKTVALDGLDLALVQAGQRVGDAGRISRRSSASRTGLPRLDLFGQDVPVARASQHEHADLLVPLPHLGRLVRMVARLRAAADEQQHRQQPHERGGAATPGARHPSAGR